MLLNLPVTTQIFYLYVEPFFFLEPLPGSSFQFQFKTGHLSSAHLFRQPSECSTCLSHFPKLLVHSLSPSSPLLQSSDTSIKATFLRF